jgi:hypothetical protein
MPAEEDGVQLRFEEGRLVEAGQRTAPVEPGQATGYCVEVREGALAVNDRVHIIVDRHGRVLEFGTRAQAETYAAWLSTLGGPLSVQATPPNETSDIDAYLIAEHSPSVAEPASIENDTWHFDVDANLYGSLGEALLLEAPKPYALTYFVKEDRALDDDPLLTIRRGSSHRGAVEARWVPDCELLVREVAGGPVRERYYCEIKTGGGSLEREQRAAMEELARSERVLLIRVGIEDLPQQYAVTVTEVDPDR